MGLIRVTQAALSVPVPTVTSISSITWETATQIHVRANEDSDSATLNSLYLEPTTTADPNPQELLDDYMYLESFKDDNDGNIILQDTSVSFESLSHSACCSWCMSIDSEYRYCGVKAGKQCFCDSTLGRNDKVTDTESSQIGRGRSEYRREDDGRVNLYQRVGGPSPWETTPVVSPGATNTPSAKPNDEEYEHKKDADDDGDGGDNGDKGGGGLSTEEIIGMAVGIPSALGALATLYQCVRRKRKV